MAGDKGKKNKAKQEPAQKQIQQTQAQSQKHQRDPTPMKRRRFSSGEASDCDPEIVIDSLLSSLSCDDNLLERFILHLFQVPNIQQKIITHVTDILSSRPADEQIQHLNVTATQSLQDSMQQLTKAVTTLTSELESSKDRCDELEQYSRRNNIRISGIPEDPAASTESLVCNVLNSYVDNPILPSEIDRCHRIFKPVAGDTTPKPKDIIVKFVSHKTKAAVVTKQPMVKLRDDNKQKPPNARIYVSEDLTRVRSRILYRTRKLKKQQQIKDTYTRDGRIIIKTLSDRFLNIVSEKELQHVCVKNQIKLDPMMENSRGSDSGGASPMATQEPAGPGMVRPGPGGSLNPEADSFEPSQSLLA